MIFRQLQLAALVLAGVSGMASAQVRAQAPAPVAPEPSVTTATYGDWTLRCARDPGDAKNTICEVTQTLVIQGQSAPVAQIAIGRLAPKAPLRLTIIVPVNIAFERAPQLQVEEQANSAAPLGWRRCTQGGCVADSEVKTETLTLWRNAAKQGQLMFRNAGNQDVALPFSFRGLAQALDQLQKS